MNDSTPGPDPRLSLEPGYSDTQAMDDIQSLITSRDRSQGEDAIDEVGEIVERTGRAVITPRVFEVAQAPKEDELPSVTVTAEGTYVIVEHAADTNSIGIAVYTMNSHDQRNLRIKVNGQRLMPTAENNADAGSDSRSAAGGSTASTDQPEGGAS